MICSVRELRGYMAEQQSLLTCICTHTWSRALKIMVPVMPFGCMHSKGTMVYLEVILIITETLKYNWWLGLLMMRTYLVLLFLLNLRIVLNVISRLGSSAAETVQPILDCNVALPSLLSETRHGTSTFTIISIVFQAISNISCFRNTQLLLEISISMVAIIVVAIIVCDGYLENWSTWSANCPWNANSIRWNSQACENKFFFSSIFFFIIAYSLMQSMLTTYL